MKATGIVRRVDDLGRIVIPKELRRTLGVKEGDTMEIFTDGKGVVLQKYAPGCTLCGSVDRKLVSLYPQKLVCHECIKLVFKERDKLLAGE